MPKTDAKHIQTSIEDTAIKWHVKLTSGDCSDADITRHLEWLLEDTAHLSMFENVAATYQQVGANQEAIEQTFPKPEIANQPITPWYKKLVSATRWPQTVTAMAGAAALLFFTAGPTSCLYDDAEKPRTYSAESVDVRMIKLADGSRVSLFTGSEISVIMDGATRKVDLVRGRAFFDIVSDKSRPFHVNIASQQVRVVGTKFEVVRATDFDKISVLEGLVAVNTLEQKDNVSAPVLIEPGISALFQGNAVKPILDTVDAENVAAWRTGVLKFRSTPIDHVMTQLRDLFPDFKLTADQNVQHVTFSGTLVVSDAESMSRELARFLSLKVTVSEGIIHFARQ